MSAAAAKPRPADRARKALLMGAVTAAGTAIPLGRLPLGRTAAISAGLGAATMGAGLLFARNRDNNGESVPSEQQSPARKFRAVATGMVVAGTVVSAGMTSSVLADRWIEDGLRRCGNTRPRVWMIAGAGVLGAVLEWADAYAPSPDSPEAGNTA